MSHEKMLQFQVACIDWIVKLPAKILNDMIFYEAACMYYPVEPFGEKVFKAAKKTNSWAGSLCWIYLSFQTYERNAFIY